MSFNFLPNNPYLHIHTHTHTIFLIFIRKYNIQDIFILSSVCFRVGVYVVAFRNGDRRYITYQEPDFAELAGKLWDYNQEVS